MGFDCVRDLEGMPPDILLVPLPGHTFGHTGVAFRSNGHWRLLAGDAYFHHREMDPLKPSCTPGLRFYQWMMEKDRDARLHNQHRLRMLRREQREVDVFCSHDVAEFERMSGRSARVPVEALVSARAYTGRDTATREPARPGRGRTVGEGASPSAPYPHGPGPGRPTRH